jgi:hypothetical protein
MNHAIAGNPPMTEANQADSGSNQSSFSGLTPYPSNPYRLPLSEIVCGECEQARPNIRSYAVIHVIGLVFFAYWRWDTHVKCPRCMRRYLGRRFLLALLLANVFAPIVVIWWGVVYLRTHLP